MPGPLDKDYCLAKGPYPGKQRGEGSLHVGHSKPSQFHPLSKQPVNINCRAYTTDSEYKRESVKNSFWLTGPDEEWVENLRDRVYPASLDVAFKARNSV